MAVIGGGVGGFAAALAALRRGVRVVLTEETDWIGGQLTSQAVPPDEHPWIEQFGCTRSYREYRSAVRDYYQRHFSLTAAARLDPVLNPGNGDVSRLCHEPAVSVAVLEAMLAPFLSSGQLRIFREHVPVAASTDHDRVMSVTLMDLRAGKERVITAKYFLDATELGDLALLSKAESVTGAEWQGQTGEMHAAPEAQPRNNQSFTCCFAVDYLHGEDHTIEKPSEYAFWRDYVPQLTPPWPGALLSWTMCDPKTLASRLVSFDPLTERSAGTTLNLWAYRRIVDHRNFTGGSNRTDVSLVNWPQNDFWLGDLVTADAEGRKAFIRRAKQLSLSLLYWMQTEAPRADGGQGWKGLQLRRDIVGTADGLAKSPYVRESRRIQAEFTVLEQHVGTEMRTQKSGAEPVAENFDDSVGIGCYRIDLHPSATGRNYIDVSSLRFQIPMGALIPQRLENLLPACKNIGTTHVTNGCYRLHPVEWNIGEAAGAIAAHCVMTQQTPRSVRKSKNRIADLQKSLLAQGFELAWPRTNPV